MSKLTGHDQVGFLESYATSRHDWRQMTKNGRVAFYRRMGIVESCFNTDGTDFEGRADLTMHLHVAMKTRLSLKQLRARVELVWALMRQKHILLSARVAKAVDILPETSVGGSEDRFYVFEPSSDPFSMLREAKQHIVFVADHFPQLDPDDFFIHTLNSSRCIDESQAMSRLYVMPIAQDQNGQHQMHFMFLAGHEIVDGLTSMRWMASFIKLLNLSAAQLVHDAAALCARAPTGRLPPAQESLYPPIRGSPARQRWSWALTRILRHTRRPPPAAFQNPLRRIKGSANPTPFKPKYVPVLDYSRTPPLNSFRIRATLGPASVRRMSRICREARISIGSGCFALVSLVMMLFEERRNPHIPAPERLPFVGSFPVNPRPFLAGKPTTGKEDSLMLAFSDGVTLPFLPSDLDLEGRLRLLGKQAHRQLRQYQKRPKTIEEEIHLGSRSPTQLLPLLYLNTMESLERGSKPHRKRGWDIQGAYPAKPPSSLSTCGVSSVGARGSIISAGRYDTTGQLEPGQDLVADFRNLDTTVRARNGEFLVGAAGDGDYLWFGVSYDGCAIDPELASQWKQVMETILLDTEKPPLPKL